VNFKFAVPNHYVYEEPGEGDSDLDKDIHYKFYAFGGYNDQTLEEILTEKSLRGMGIEGKYKVLYKPDAGWGHKHVVMSLVMPLGQIKQYYLDRTSDHTLVLKPCVPIWYQCIKLTEDEMNAMTMVVDGIAKRRVTKKQKIDGGEIMNK
jgi:hypothetical protein